MNAVNYGHRYLAARAVAEELFPPDDTGGPINSEHLLREAICWKLANPERTDEALAVWFGDAVDVLTEIPGNRTAAENTASLLQRTKLFVETERDTVETLAGLLATYPGVAPPELWLSRIRVGETDPDNYASDEDWPDDPEAPRPRFGPSLN